MFNETKLSTWSGPSAFCFPPNVIRNPSEFTLKAACGGNRFKRSVLKIKTCSNEKELKNHLIQ